MLLSSYMEPKLKDLAPAIAAKLHFHQITLSDLPKIDRLLRQYPMTHTCDMTIGGIYMWIDCFRYEYCIFDETLFIKGFAENMPGVTAFSLPVGRLPLDRAVGLIRQYCDTNGIEMIFSAIPEERAAAVAALSGGRCEELDGWADYVYEASALAALTGKKLSKKRNHVNHFMLENPNYEIETLTPDLIPEVLMFLTGRPLAEKLDVSMALYEQEESVKVLANYSAYPFEGLVLRGESGEIVAFTIGEVMGDTLFVHIEKMNHEVTGAGETINRLFAAEMLRRYPQLGYINREEDMGDPGLRHAKESYHPVALLRKYNIR